MRYRQTRWQKSQNEKPAAEIGVFHLIAFFIIGIFAGYMLGLIHQLAQNPTIN